MKADALRPWWQGRSGREKAMVAAGVLGAVLVAGDALVTAPLSKRVSRAQAEVQAQQLQVAQAEAAVKSERALAQTQQQQEARLRERLQAAQAASQALRQRATDTTRLPETLRAVIGTVGSARLLALELGADSGATPAAAATPGTASAPAAASAPSTTLARRMHRLPITLKVAGSYDELQLVLSQIERHAEALQWSQLTLDNSEWPAIQLTLKAHVPSLSPRWGAGS